MDSKRQVCAGLVLLCAVSPGGGAYAQDVSDPVTQALNAVPTLPSAFVGITPCRLADTRTPSGFSGPYGPPAMVAQTPRVFPVAGQCGIPATARAVSANLAVTNTTGLGSISVWPGGDPQPNPLVASMNYSAGQTIANAVLAPLGSGGITVYARVGLDLIIDVNGYFDTGAEPTHEIGASGQPVFTDTGFCRWSNYDAPGGTYATAAFYKDASGVVHLKGLVKAIELLPGFGFCAPSVSPLIFTLPAGYRPSKRSLFSIITSSQLGRVDIDTDGKVLVDGQTPNIATNVTGWLSLEGITFRPAP